MEKVVSNTYQRRNYDDLIIHMSSSINNCYLFFVTVILQLSQAAMLPLYLCQASRSVLPATLLEDEHGQKVSCHGLQKQNRYQHSPMKRERKTATKESLQVTESLDQHVAKANAHQPSWHPAASSCNNSEWKGRKLNKRCFGPLSHQKLIQIGWADILPSIHSNGDQLSVVT